MSLKKQAAVSVSTQELERLLAAAERASDAAAKVTMQYFRQSLNVDNKAGENAFDPVTQADKEAEIAIREILSSEFPQIGFYGEEHDAVESESGLTWVVDPIDGTRAFMSGMPLWGTLIGLFNGENAILGVMDQPFFNERFTAANGLSQLRNASSVQTLKTRSGISLESATMYCTTPDMFVGDQEKRRFEGVKDAVQLTRYGGDCYAYGLLAAGHVDVVLDCDLKPYDIQALIPIIEAAGGVVTDWQGNSAVDGGFVVASGSSAIHEQTLKILQMP